MIDKQKLSNFLESRASLSREIEQKLGFGHGDYYEGARKEAIMLSEMIKNGEFDVEEKQFFDFALRRFDPDGP